MGLKKFRKVNKERQKIWDDGFSKMRDEQLSNQAIAHFQEERLRQIKIAEASRFKMLD